MSLAPDPVAPGAAGEELGADVRRGRAARHLLQLRREHARSWRERVAARVVAGRGARNF